MLQKTRQQLTRTNLHIYFEFPKFSLRHLHISQERTLHLSQANHISPSSVLVFSPTILQKAPTFSKLSPTFLEKAPTFFEKAPTFFEESPSFSREPATFEGNLKTYPQGIRGAFGGFYTIGTKPKDLAQGKCHKLLPQPEVGSLPRWAFSRQHSGDCSPHFNPCTTVYSSPYTTF